MTKKSEKFIWTDKLVLQFCKVAASGSYGIYENAKRIEKKLKIFKKIINEQRKSK